jgi:hypothetical protein
VRVLAIDALGVQHYVDAADGASGDADDVEQALTSVLRNLLREADLTAFVTKAALFEPVPLPDPWPFDVRLRPVAPADFMPPAWRSLVALTVVLSRAPGARSAVLLAGTHASGGVKVPVALLTFDITGGGLKFGAPAAAGRG